MFLRLRLHFLTFEYGKLWKMKNNNNTVGTKKLRNFCKIVIELRMGMEWRRRWDRKKFHNPKLCVGMGALGMHRIFGYL